jgi:hypothetical protein
MNRKHRSTLRAIYEMPVRANLLWSDVVALLLALGAEVNEGTGSRVRIKLLGVRMVLHRPHPEKELDKGAVVTVRAFLKHAGVEPDGEHV